MKKLLIIGAVLFLALAAFLFWPKSSKPFPDADLQLARTEVPPHENGFFLLMQATNVADFSEEAFTVISNLKQSESWDSNRVAEVLSEYEKALELWAKAVELPRLQVPEIKSFDDQSRKLFPSWKALANLTSLKCKAFFRSGKESEAFALALQIIQFGQSIEQCEGTLVHYMFGNAVKQLGFGAIREMTATTTLTGDDLQILVKKLSVYSASQTALTNAIKTEYQIQVNSIEDIRAGSSPGSSNTKIQRVGSALMSRWLLNEEATKSVLAEFARKQLKAIPQNWSAMPTNLAPPLPVSLPKRLLTGNQIGNVMTQMMLPGQEKFLSHKCRENVHLAATQIVLALRCHQMKSGVLPRSLDELVPEFLPAVPLDDFDGQPMRYSPEKRLIYSVGQDLIDSGGQEKGAQNEPLDIPFTIEF